MSGFSDGWLALREPADLRARARSLLPHLKAWARTAPGRPIHDLGCGSGANLRALAPQLGRWQVWHLYDHDARLLAALPARLSAWATRHGWEMKDLDGCVALAGAGWSARVSWRVADLARGFALLGDTTGGLLTGSALLDLVSKTWLDLLLALPAAAFYFPLVVDGRRALSPVEPEDGPLLASFSGHQGGDKGFGPALGTDAPEAFGRLAEAQGLRVLTARSDWDLGAEESELQRALIEELASHGKGVLAAEAVEGWRRRRLQTLASGGGRSLVGHRDLLALRPRP